MKRRTLLGVAGTALTGTAAATLLPTSVKAGANAEQRNAVEASVLELE